MAVRALWEGQGGGRAGMANGRDGGMTKQYRTFIPSKKSGGLLGKTGMAGDLTQPLDREPFGEGSVGTEEFRSSLGKTTGRPTYLDQFRLYRVRPCKSYTVTVPGDATKFVGTGDGGCGG